MSHLSYATDLGSSQLCEFRFEIAVLWKGPARSRERRKHKAFHTNPAWVYISVFSHWPPPHLRHKQPLIRPEIQHPPRALPCWKSCRVKSTAKAALLQYWGKYSEKYKYFIFPLSIGKAMLLSMTLTFLQLFNWKK